MRTNLNLKLSKQVPGTVRLANINYKFRWKCVFVKRGLWSHYRRDIRKRRNACAHRKGAGTVPYQLE
jgi:hypothetical protein